jgi:hypothetical protein
MLAKVASPASDGSDRYAKKAGDVPLAPSIGKPEHRQQTNLLQHKRRPWQGEHGWHYEA